MGGNIIEKLAALDGHYRDLAVLGGEVILLLSGCLMTFLVVRLSFHWAGSVAPLKKHLDRLTTLRRLIGKLLLVTLLLLLVLILSFNGYLVYQGKDLFEYTRDLIGRIPPGFWVGIATGLIKVAGLAVGAWFFHRALRRMIGALRERAKAYEQFKANDESVDAFFLALGRIVSSTIWLSVLILASGLLPLPPVVSKYLWVVLRIYLIIAFGALVVRTISSIVESLEALSKKYWYREDYLGWYERLKGLVPLFRRCLEYIIYVFVATLVLLQVDFIAKFADYGPRMVKVIGIFFLTRVVVEVVNLLVDRMMGDADELDEAERKRQLTLVPIIKSLLQYVVYFVAFVLMLSVFELNPMPLLAGAGIVGIVVGLGAQPLINDIVSGFFVLFENLFLIGDYVETGEARGVVEAIEIRTTRIRDPDGQVHILRNGQIGSIINYSKGYTHAVVEVGVAYDSDLDHVYRVLNETGEQLKEQNPYVLLPTEVKGLANFGESELLVRTVTKVKPGHHRDVAFMLRKMIKTAFDAEGIEIPFARRVLIFKKEGDDSGSGAFDPGLTSGKGAPRT